MDSRNVWFQTFSNTSNDQTGVISLAEVGFLYPANTGLGGTWCIEVLGVSGPGGATVYIATGIDTEADAFTMIATLLADAVAAVSTAVTVTPVILNGNA